MGRKGGGYTFLFGALRPQNWGSVLGSATPIGIVKNTVNNYCEKRYHINWVNILVGGFNPLLKILAKMEIIPKYW